MRIKFVFRIIILAFATLIFNTQVFAQGSSFPTGGLKYFLYGVIAFVVVSLSLAIYFLTLKNKYMKEARLRSGKFHERSQLRQWWSKLDQKYFTKAASLEKEADVLLDHDYDGIKELDNALPPWWKWGFYITIVVGVIYLFRFHVIKTGPTPLQEYDNEMRIAAAHLEDFRKNSREAFDETTVTLADEKGIAEGKKIFTGTCFPCHGANGEGNAVGPNLTDKYWLHGGSLGNVFKTISIGVPDKGMQAWGKTFSPTDVRNLASFVLSLQGTNPANAKAPQGNLFEVGKTRDSTVAKKDSLTQPVK
ncbi:MAG TPA: cbb3-type cytochrome c oxidase N-terminal domain-containing protein [Chitinophagaceae bacterium]|nr:cbb3-type cytochrome c oxidase N-terminal domain-containing protein [Chitinophagaceae bacterium]